MPRIDILENCSQLEQFHPPPAGTRPLGGLAKRSWILLRHRVVNPLQLLAIEFRRTPKQRLGLRRSPAATSILRQPAIDCRTINAENISNDFWAFTILNTAHRTLTHRLQCSVIQLPRIVCPAQRELYSRRHVKKSLLTYVLIRGIFSLQEEDYHDINSPLCDLRGHEKPWRHESDPTRILCQTLTARPVCCRRSSGAAARKAGQHWREWPPSFWQNEIPFFHRTK